MSTLTYHLINTNNLLNNITSSIFETIVHELLVQVDLSITIIKTNNLSNNISSLNFTNFQILESETYFLVTPQILTTYKFDLLNMSLIDSISNKSYPISDQHSYLINKITSQLTKPNFNNSTSKPNTIFEQTNQLIQKVTSTTPVSKTRLIPTVKDSDESEEDSIEDNLEINPNISKPLNSKIFDIDAHCSAKQLEESLLQLQNLKAQELSKLETLKLEKEKDALNFNNYCNNLGNDERTLRIEKEREEEKRNKFEGNKVAYNKMKIDIESGKLKEENISKLFTREYPIYKFMDQNNLLDTDEEYITYLNLYNDMYPNKETEYMSESSLYKNLDSNINTFSSGGKSYAPIDEILNAISSSSSEEVNNSSVSSNEELDLEIDPNINFGEEEKMDTLISVLKKTLDSN
jgi:hypothetical protein